MRRIIGTVQTENPEDAGTVVFTLQDVEGNLISCRSGAGYRSAKPKVGSKIVITGDTIREIITGGESHEFFYHSLEVLPSNN
jgi:hypothetical protein